MANIVGTATEDFVHVSGDGLQPPSQSWNNMPFATNAADTIDGAGANDILIAGGGADSVSGGLGLDDLYGQGGNDTLDGGAADDNIYAGDGNDLVLGDAGGDNVDGEGGNDTLQSLGADALDGGDGDDLLIANQFDPPGGGGIVQFVGGAGTDTLRLLDGQGVQSGFDQALFLLCTVGGFERFEYATAMDTNAVFVSFQFPGAIALNGTISGSAHRDGLTFVAAAPGTWDYSAANYTFVNWNWSQDFLALTTNSAETGAYTITGTKFNDVVVGALGADSFTGGAGNDTLSGAAGNDTLTGGTGTDSFIGGAGDDTFADVEAGETVTEAAGEGADTVQTRVTFSLAAVANVENLVLTGSAVIDGTGNTLANRIDGNGVANRLDGSTGNDTLNGSNGNDTLVGGNGDDVLNGGPGNDSMTGGLGNDIYLNPAAGDTIVEAAGQGTGTDTVQSAATFILPDNVERLTLVGGAVADGTGNPLANLIAGNGVANKLFGLGGNDTINASNGNDSLDGGIDNDSLNGGAGNDTLLGGAGNDTMNGGSGNDLFRFGAGAGADTIVGFEKAHDRFDIGVGNFTAATPSGGDTLLTYAGGTILLKGVAMTLAEANALHPAPFVPEFMAGQASADAGLFAATPHPAVAPLALTPFDYVFA